MPYVALRGENFIPTDLYGHVWQGTEATNYEGSKSKPHIDLADVVISGQLKSGLLLVSYRTTIILPVPLSSGSLGFGTLMPHTIAGLKRICAD